jgi:hypothetical protein
MSRQKCRENVGDVMIYTHQVLPSGGVIVLRSILFLAVVDHVLFWSGTKSDIVIVIMLSLHLSLQLSVEAKAV